MRSDVAAILDDLIELRNEIIKEIETRSTEVNIATGMKAGSNIGKRGCVRRLTAIIDKHDTRTKRYDYSPLDDIGSLYTIDEFYENVVDGGFCDYDGDGRFANKELNIQYNDVSVLITDDETEIAEIKVRAKQKGYTHVKWYNR